MQPVNGSSLFSSCESSGQICPFDVEYDFCSGDVKRREVAEHVVVVGRVMFNHLWKRN